MGRSCCRTTTLPDEVRGKATSTTMGTAVLNGDQTITYTPDPGFVGNDTFTYTIRDNANCTFTSEQDTATVYITVYPDTDSDGIADRTDWDDDNDGIQDSVECPLSVLWVTQGTASAEEQNVIDKLTAQGYSVTVVDDGVGGNANNYDVTFIYEDAVSSTAFANVANMATTANGIVTSEPALYDEILGATSGASSATGTLAIVNNTHPITIGLSYGNNNIGDGSYHSISLSSGTVLGNHPNGEVSLAAWEKDDPMDVGIAPGRRVIVPHGNANGGFNTLGEDLLVQAILWAATRAPSCDSDSDGIIDSLELDSDNDGCNDVVEAGFTDDDSDGLLGPSPVTVDANGLVTSGSDGYTTPADADSNLVFDFQEAGSAPSISVQPVDVTICPGCVGSFSVTSADADSYQWQLFSGTWVNLTDTGIYSGTTTNVLTITDPTTAENGNQYRVILTDAAFVCGSTISNTAILTIQVNTVITNRKITYRINPN